MKTAVYQFQPRFGEPVLNRKKILSTLAKVDADLIVLPELAVSGYNFSSPSDLTRGAEAADGPTAEMLRELATKSGAHYVCGIAEQGDGGAIYNSAILVGPGGFLGCYRKLHLFFKEKEFFTPGGRGFSLFDITTSTGEKARLGLLVCFDHMFPEAARSLALKGAQVICHPSNLVLPEYAQLTSRVRALENRMFWLMANRVGSESGAAGDLTFTGCSQIVAQNGALLAAAGAEKEELLLAEIDPKKADIKKINDHNDLFEDRRVDFYML